MSPGPERSEEVSVDDRLGSSSSVGCGWYMIGGYIGYSYGPRREAVLTDFLWGQHGGAVFAAVGVGSVQDVRIAASPLVGGKYAVAGSTLVVDNDEEGYRNKDK